MTTMTLGRRTDLNTVIGTELPDTVLGDLDDDGVRQGDCCIQR